MKNLRFFSFIVVLAIVAGAAIFYINYHYGLNNIDSENAQVAPEVVNTPPLSPPSTPPSNPAPGAPAVPPPAKPATTSPTTLLLKVPFTSQAPTANWDQVHNEDCEEAVSVMAYEYYSGNKSVTLPAPLVETELTKLNNWETANLGYNLDTNSAETAQMIEKVYGLQTQMINNFTAQDIKNQLEQNRVVIISENGQKLGNPNYKQPGPLHHMLLIKGYTPEGFVTNDSGTRNGLNYFYTFNTIYNAAGDWNHATNDVDLSNKIAIVVWK